MTPAVDPLTAFEIPYAAVLAAYHETDYEGAVKAVAEVLPEKWIEAYATMSLQEPKILEFSDHGFVFLFDFVSTGKPNESPRDSAEQSRMPADRVVAVYGRTQPAAKARDASRMRGFLGGPIVDRQGSRRDKGHFAAHTVGGGLDVNLFPQLTPVNRGWSTRGKVFRQMERHGARHPGTFVFSRPIYVDDTWTPAALEYGLLLPEMGFWVERFAN